MECEKDDLLTIVKTDQNNQEYIDQDAVELNGQRCSVKSVECEQGQSGNKKRRRRCSMANMVETKVENRRKTFCCRICRYDTTFRSHIRRHLFTHTGYKPLKCSVCSYSCIQSHSLRQHMATHSADTPFHCEQCSYKCALKYLLDCHIMRRHSDQRPYGCAHCEYRTAVRSDLVKHFRRLHRRTVGGEKTGGLSQVKNAVEPNDQPGGSSENKECGQSHIRMKMWRRQSPIDPKIVTTKVIDGHKTYFCRECTYKTTASRNIRYHLRSHIGLKPPKCSVCSLKCIKSNSLKENESIDPKEKRHMCSSCLFKCSRFFDLERRRNTWTHSTEKLFHCDQYAYECFRKEQLAGHMPIDSRRYVGEENPVGVSQVENIDIAPNLVQCSTSSESLNVNNLKSTLNVKLEQCGDQEDTETAVPIGMGYPSTSTESLHIKDIKVENPPLVPEPEPEYDSVEINNVEIVSSNEVGCSTARQSLEIKNLKKALNIKLKQNYDASYQEDAVENDWPGSSECEGSQWRTSGIETDAETIDIIDRHRIYCCPICSYKTVHMTRIIKHKLIHKQEHKCRLCPSSFAASGPLELHMISHARKSYNCSVCAFSSVWPCSMRGHMKRHVKDTDYMCALCLRRFNQTVTLPVHKTHPGKKAFRCTECSFNCNRVESFNIHMTTHCAQNAYDCEAQPYSCIWASTKRLDEEKRQEYLFCFDTACSLGKHLVTHS